MTCLTNGSCMTQQGIELSSLKRQTSLLIATSSFEHLPFTLYIVTGQFISSVNVDAFPLQSPLNTVQAIFILKI